MIFGKLLALTHSIEFQKRGYPHAHIIIWLDCGNLKHVDAVTLNKMICAEIPNKYKQQKLNATHKKLEDLEINPLWKVVTSFMLHGPCNTSMACMKQGYCKYGFPKPYVSVTEMSENGYPVYSCQSPEQGGNSHITYRKGEQVTYTNANVVPYNKYLLYKYNCHINVEYCHSVKAIKYHLKYINKGVDEANVTVGRGPSHNETENVENEHTNEVR
jgi:hypothetical protein